ncbi:hypothetical protein LCGC14_0629270 [marine sediment metagenome]|uniref:Uncharacterized protein n=1 Tax=marine sediment metagenome TaxID=412755 RepID=A0A0F9RLV5_9ZZZZ
MRLGKKQKYVLKKMALNWELGRDLAFRGTPWLQEGGCGYGGETDYSISSSVLQSLYVKKLIKVAYKRFPLEGYELTTSGKAIVENIL